MSFSYYPWHMDERYAFPLLQCMRERGLYEEVLHLSVEFLRYHHFSRDKERALVRPRSVFEILVCDFLVCQSLLSLHSFLFTCS